MPLTASFYLQTTTNKQLTQPLINTDSDTNVLWYGFTFKKSCFCLLELINHTILDNSLSFRFLLSVYMHRNKQCHFSFLFLFIQKFAPNCTNTVNYTRSLSKNHTQIVIKISFSESEIYIKNVTKVHVKGK